MQKLVYSASSFFLFVIAPFLLFSGCSRDDIGRHDPVDPDSMVVTFDITGNSPATYALSHDDELSISEVKLLLFNINNELIAPTPIEGVLHIVSPGKIKVEAKVQLGKYSNIILLANSKSILDDATLAKDMTYNQVREQLLLNFNDKWVAKKGGANYLGIPMYGETGFVNVKFVDANNFSTSLTRMLCRVDLAVDVNVQPTFNLTSVRVYNRDVVGMLPAPKEAGKPLMPTTPSKIVGPLIYQGTEITSTGKAIAGEIYLMESLVKGSNDINRLNGATCLVVGGFYTHNGIVSAKELFYRVDFSTSHSATELYPRHYYDLVRSHHYKINIISVSGPGEEKPEVALEKEISFIDVVVTDWGTGGAIDGAVDGQYTLRLSQGEFNLFSQAYIEGSTDNKLTVSSNHPDGWWIEKITDESGAEMPSGGWLSTTLPLNTPQMSDNTFSLLLKENDTTLPRVGYIYINAGPRMQYKMKVTQKPVVKEIGFIVWEDYDGVNGAVYKNDGSTIDNDFTKIVITAGGVDYTPSFTGGKVTPTLEFPGDITKVVVTYKGYEMELPASKYSYDISTKTLTVTDRSLIAKPVHLDKIRTQVETISNRDYITGDYIQMVDLDLSGYANWEPIGTWDVQFRGTYTGKYLMNEYKISNLTIDRPTEQHVGLFGYMSESTSSLNGIHIASGSVVAFRYAGAICGYSYDGGTISGCTNSVTVTGKQNAVGGICGWNNKSIITNCTNAGNIKGIDNNIGGICGYNTGGTISNCTNSGTVTGSRSTVGGICGENVTGAIITGCHNLRGGDVKGTYCIGGICGENDKSEIWNCSNAATVTGSASNLAGICGKAVFVTKIINCHNLLGGDVISSSAGGQFYAGIIGEAGYCEISKCTNAATVTATGAWYNVGGIAGYITNDTSITDCHNLLGANVKGTSIVGGICGYNVACIVSLCTNAATVTGTNTVGGICGRGGGARGIYACINTASASVLVTNNGGTAGGICGFDGGAPINACYNLASVTATANVGAIIGYVDTAPVDCYFGGNANFASDPANGSTKFGDGIGGTGWPNVGMTNWSEYHAENNPAGYWKSIGKWNGGVNIEYPQLRTTP